MILQVCSPCVKMHVMEEEIFKVPDVSHTVPRKLNVFICTAKWWVFIYFSFPNVTENLFIV